MTAMGGLAGRSVLVVGLGTTGPAAARALVRAGAKVRAIDARARRDLAGPVEGLERLGVDVRTGVARDDLAPVEGCDLVVPSPGVPEAHPLLAAAGRTGTPVWSEPELAWQLAHGATRLVGVTGTNGKTTTTALLASCLGAPAAGNIGTPLVDVLAPSEGAPPALVVAELSSFHLRYTDELRCGVGVLLNVADDHLDWHGTPEAYRAAKARVWANQEEDDWAVTNADDAGANEILSRHPPRGRLVAFTLGTPAAEQVGIEDGAVVARLGGTRTRLVGLDELGVSGPHNHANACAAVAAALAAGADAEAIAGPLRAFRAGPHRLEQVAVVGGVTWVNDSKATNPHAAAAALASFDRVVWIAGGLAKGVSFDMLADVLGERVRAVVTIGSSGPAIADLARGLGVTAVEASDLDTAVTAAAGLADPGDTVLLAPACASMDQFRDYAHRGDVFRHAVRALAAAPGSDRPAAPRDARQDAQ